MATIRPAAPRDLQAIAEIHVRSWQTAFRGIMPGGLLGGMDVADRREMWRGQIRRHPESLLVAADERETLLGFCCLGPAQGDANDAPYEGRLYALHVRPDLKRRGLGTRLVGAAFGRLHDLGCRAAIIWTLEALAPSRRFYERLGGRVVKSKITDFHGTGLVEVGYGFDDLAR